jgi:pimeloyl-ACP methyl ester carboxylesterase
MHITVQGHSTYCYTGTKALDAAKPTIVFIHGVLNDHSVWILQSRYFAHHGFNVLAIDLPGHAKSAGEPLKTVADAAAWVHELLQAAGVPQAALVGHSLGSLIALEAAALKPQAVSHLALLGTAAPMKVSPALLDASLNAPFKAIDMVNTFSHSTLAPPPSCYGPGTWLYGGSRALMRRVLASNSKVNVFHHGFSMCDSYEGAVAAAERWAQAKKPTAVIGGAADAAQSLATHCPSHPARPAGPGCGRPRHDDRGTRGHAAGAAKPV